MKQHKLGNREVSAIGIGCMNVSWIWSDGAALDPERRLSSAIPAIHAGLECGLLGSVYPNWDMISFGPTIRSPHSPDERVKIDTVIKFWDFLKETLKNVPTK